ncbi:MAG: hypothetical protein JJE29_04825 [Peptostreptococcaceae bacterium]|nr:hypothetical protein [Peptostreptococcaceae bacterium]
MARTAGIETLEKKIEKAQDDVVKTKEKYDTAVTKLSDLMDKKDALKKEQLVNAIMKSDKTYDEVLQFLDQSKDTRK